MSKLQRRIGNAIRLQFSDFKVEENKRPDWLTTEAGERLELDFYIKELDLAFEIQGEQHYTYSPRFHNSPEGFAALIRRDAAKRRLCREHGIQLFEVATLGEYEALEAELSAILRSHKDKQIRDYILQKVSQELINNFGIRKKIDEGLNLLPSLKEPKTIARCQRLIAKSIFNLELSHERIRCLSVVAINEFEGRVRPKGKERHAEWKRRKYEGIKSGAKYKPLRNNRRLI